MPLGYVSLPEGKSQFLPMSIAEYWFKKRICTELKIAA
jgi:hypothetical protein